MNQYEKPLPFVTEDGQPFWKGCQQHELLIQKCQDCGGSQFPPRVVCVSCSSMNLEWIKTQGKGVVYSYTVVHRAPTKALSVDAPYVVAMIDLEEGVRILSWLVDFPVEELKVGLPVAVTFADVTDEITLPMFGPDRQSRAENGRVTSIT